MKILINVNLSKEKSRLALPKVLDKLLEYELIPLLDISLKGETDKPVVFDTFENNSANCDIFMTIGGDGTILRWGKNAAKAGKPLLGINTGRLGFMATLEIDELDKLKKLKDGKYKTSKRMIFDITHISSDKSIEYCALNDVVLSKGGQSKLPEFIVSSNGVEVTRIRADGIIISTATGSTAYSLSAGGPIIDPSLECFELTSLCAHTLFNRPIIFSADGVLQACYEEYEECSVFLSVDGKENIELSPDDVITVKKSNQSLELIDLDGNSFLDSIHNKLMKPLK